MQSSAASVLIAMGVDKDSHFLDIGAGLKQDSIEVANRSGSGHGLVPFLAALLLKVRKATGVEVEKQCTFCGRLCARGSRLAAAPELDYHRDAGADRCAGLAVDAALV